MKIIKIISEWKKRPKNLDRDKKRVEAVVEIDGRVQTKHIDIPKND